MYQPWQWLKRGNYSFFSHCRAGTKWLLALKDTLDDCSPELQYLPRKQNSGFFFLCLCVPIEYNKMSQEIRFTKLLVKNNLTECYKWIFISGHPVAQWKCLPFQGHSTGKCCPCHGWHWASGLCYEQTGNIMDWKEETLRFLHQNHEVVWKGLKKTLSHSQTMSTSVI